MTAEQRTIDRIIDELDVDVGILITVDGKWGSMCAASKKEIENASINKLLLKISNILFKKSDSLGEMKTANKIPI